jgi:hypothetical protein
VKNINFALADLTTNNEKMSKKSREILSEEQKTLKYLRAIIEEQKKLSRIESAPDNLEGIEIGEQQVKLITQEAAEDLCMLEKKCQELVWDNQEMQKVLNGLEVQTPELHVRPRLVQASKIIEELASHSHHDISKDAKSVKKLKIHGNYSHEISSQLTQWSSHVTLESPGLSTDLAKLILKVHQKKLKKHSDHDQTLTHLHSKKSHLEQKIRSLEISS